MANTCFNELYFTGESSRVKVANIYLAHLIKDDWGGVCIEATNGYFQDIEFGNGHFCFGTRWGPDLMTSQAIADRFKVGFVLDYCEPMMSLYGQAKYERGKINDVRLEIKDFASVAYLDKDDVYLYNNARYTALETLARNLLKEKLLTTQSFAKKKNLKLKWL